MLSYRLHHAAKGGGGWTAHQAALGSTAVIGHQGPHNSADMAVPDETCMACGSSSLPWPTLPSIHLGLVVLADKARHP